MDSYKKKLLQPMRPYIEGECMDNISVPGCDTPEVGGMVAVNPDNEDDKWYVAKQFFEDNYEPANREQPITFEDRLRLEIIELTKRCEKLLDFVENNADFHTLSKEHQYLLQNQLAAMGLYLNTLNRRLELIKGAQQ